MSIEQKQNIFQSLKTIFSFRLDLLTIAKKISSRILSSAKKVRETQRFLIDTANYVSRVANKTDTFIGENQSDDGFF